MKPSSSIMDRIRKCLNLADKTKGATEAEAAAAMAAAKRLMQEHNLSMSDVELKEEAQAGANVTMDSCKRKNDDMWVQYVARIPDALFGTKHYFTYVPHPKDGKQVRHAMFVGAGQDSAISAEVYTILVDMVYAMGYATGYKGKEKTSYCLGVVQTLYKRAQDSVQDATPAQEEKCRSVMVLKNQIVDQHLKKMALRPMRRSNPSVNSAAYNHGKIDGRGVDMNFRRALK